MRNEMMITLMEFTAMMKNVKTYVKGCLMGYDMITDVLLTGGKKNSMQGRVQKVHMNFLVFIFSNKVMSSYGKMVNKRLVESGKEGNFVPSQLPWGVRVDSTACIENKGIDYVQTIQFQTAEYFSTFASQLGVELNEEDKALLDQAILDQLGKNIVGYKTPFGECHYTLDGVKIDKKDIEGLKPSSSNGEQGGLEKEMKVIVRSPKLKGFTRVALNGTTYRIVD